MYVAEQIGWRSFIIVFMHINLQNGGNTNRKWKDDEPKESNHVDLFFVLYHQMELHSENGMFVM